MTGTANTWHVLQVARASVCNMQAWVFRKGSWNRGKGLQQEWRQGAAGRRVVRFHCQERLTLPYRCLYMLQVLVYAAEVVV